MQWGHFDLLGRFNRVLESNGEHIMESENCPKILQSLCKMVWMLRNRVYYRFTEQQNQNNRDRRPI